MLLLEKKQILIFNIPKSVFVSYVYVRLFVKVLFEKG